MEKSCSFGGRNEFLWGLLVIFLLFSCTKAQDGKIKSVVDPTGNVNLSPFQQYRSVYECMQNVSSSCHEKYNITETGMQNVSKNDTADYCTHGGCAEHNMGVLMCISLVKRDYRFANKITPRGLNDTIIALCGFDLGSPVSDARKLMFESKIMALVSALTMWFLAGHINM